MDYLSLPYSICIRRLWWQKQGLQQTSSGYSSKLVTEYMLYRSDDLRLRRVYAICWSNVASYYVIIRGEAVYLRDQDLELAIHKSSKGEF